MIGILTEKPSAAKNFATALGGMTGTYNGEQYRITVSHGHLYGLALPKEQVSSDKQEKYSKWSISNLPWDINDLQWKKTEKKGASETLGKIENDLSDCDEIIIATDDDPTGEGELLAWEILDGLGLRGIPTSRMYFEDEAPKSIQKAFTSRKKLPDMENDPDYKKAYFRERWDFTSMQFTRIATIEGDGKTVIRVGRLKSAMVVLVGDQLKAIKNYKKIPFYENRFKDENGVTYSNPEEPRFEKNEDVPRIYKESDVVVDSKETKHTPPRKLIDLATLSSMLAAKGIPAQTTLDTYQKMYEDHIVSYPRTEDKKITPEQFNELLPLTDSIADVVGVDKSLLTHRTPRNTHIKTGMAHGANRPGTTVPESLDSLKEKYGTAAPLIYDILAKSYLAMLAEDYEYEAQKGHVKDYPKFTGSANIPLKMGWKLVFSDSDDTDEDENKKGLGTHAQPFVYEGFPPKPAAPTMKWLMKQLEKRNVGTGATRASIYAEITKKADKYNVPLLKDTKGKISMTEYGDMAYTLLPGTHIGDLSLTEHVYDEMKGVAEGTLDADACLEEISGYVVDDIKTMTENGRNIQKKSDVERYKCIWNGNEASFKREWNGRRFTDEECEALAGGQHIEFHMNNQSGDDCIVGGALGIKEYKGKNYLCFCYDRFENTNPEKERYTCLYNGEKRSFARVWCGHRFTDEECDHLVHGYEIGFSYQDKDGDTVQVMGRLAEQEYKGKKYIGFKVTSSENSNPDKERASGTFKGTEVSFKRTWGGHRFTDEEVTALLNGDKIEFITKNKQGHDCKVTGILAKQKYKGFSYYGFQKELYEDISSGKPQAEKYAGIWKKKQVAFKRVFRGHRFTDAECEALLAGKTVPVRGLMSKEGNVYSLNCQLANMEYKGYKYVGIEGKPIR